ncbi:hypothetical protein ACKOKD_02155 [Bacillus mojavensis]|jgi:hypothetical protein|uniref:hypothetical protein n=1 Tax=Bacillus mojavensis TaxID=72360 RepID=UPI0032EA440F
MEGVGREIRLKPNKCGKKKTIKPKQQKNVLYAAVWHFQSEGPNERGEGNTNSKSTGGNQDKGANNIGKPRLSSKEIASKAMEYESV